MLRLSPLQLLQYIQGTRAVTGGSAAALVQEYLQRDGASKRAANLPVSQRYYYQKKAMDESAAAGSDISQRHHMIQLRLGSAQMLAPAEGRVLNHNEAHPLYYAQTSPREAGLAIPLVLSLRRLGIRQLTELQGALIPLMLKGKHVIAHSETGTGKSFGIALAVANRIVRGNINYRLHTIILVPTEELALQYDKWFRHFGGCSAQVVQAAVDSIPLEAQLAKLHNVQPHVLVGTPQRIADINRMSPTILGEKLRRKVDCVILDEADLILSAAVRYGRQELSGSNLVDRIFRSQRDEVPAQLVAASATVDGATAQTLNTWTRNDKAVRLTTSFVEHTIPPAISFYFYSESREVPLPHGLELMLRLICRQNAAPRVLVFTEAHEVDRVCALLEEMQPRVKEAQSYLSGNASRKFSAALQSAAPQEMRSATAASSEAANNEVKGPRRAALPQPVRPHQIVAQHGNVYVKNNSTLSMMNEGSLLVGVGSFEMSRGLHVHGITHVIIYGVCPPASQFVHCAGRTGRMGAEGDVIVLYPPASGRSVQQVCQSVDLPFTSGKWQTVKDLLDNDHFSTADSLGTVRAENEHLAHEEHMRRLRYLREDGPSRRKK